MNPLNPPVIKHNLKFLPPAKELVAMQQGSGFGQYIEHAKKLKEWKNNPLTKVTWVSQKRHSTAAAIREFQDLYKPTEFFASFGKNDDSFQLFYRSKNPCHGECQ